MDFLGDYVAEFKRGKDKRPRKRRRKTPQQVNESRRLKAYSGNPYYGTKVDRNIRRTEMGTRAVRNLASGDRAASDVSREFRSWKKYLDQLKELKALGGG